MGESPDLAGPLSNGASIEHADGAARKRASVLRLAAETLDGEGLDYLVIGGIATSTWGRPGAIRDIDFFLTAEGAGAAKKALDDAAFTTEVAEPEWLYKAYRDGVLVDLIFCVRGNIRLDSEMLARGRAREIMGVSVRLVAPEDLIVMLACSDKHDTNYWYNALGVLQRSNLDWDYFVRRASVNIPRLASLVLYATGEGIDVPKRVVGELLEQFDKEPVT